MERCHVSVGATCRSPLHHRQSLRLKGYDYSQAGAYFVTLCIHDRACLLGEIKDEKMQINDIGRIVAEEWIKTAEMRKAIELDEYIIMPNHFHAILFITDDGGGDRRGDLQVAPTTSGNGPKPKSIGAIMAGFKSAAAKRINTLRGTAGVPVWQRNYYEHIIRNDESLNRIRQYIINNPAQWAMDRENPNRVSYDD